MKEKEKAIIEAGIKLISKKGFNATSIQEIVNEAGISKGAFYLYFKSKESLLMAIFRFYVETIESKILDIEAKGLEPREQFRQQLIVHFEEIKNHKEFIIMQARENALPFNDELHSFIMKMRRDKFMFFRSNIIAIYGNPVLRMIEDATIIVQGVADSYLEFIIFDLTTIDFENLVTFLLKRIDQLISGLIETDEKPIITTQDLNLIKTEALVQKGLLLDQVIADARHVIRRLPTSEELLVSLEVISDEIHSGTPRKAVIKGMLRNLQEADGIDSYITQIADAFEL